MRGFFNTHAKLVVVGHRHLLGEIEMTETIFKATVVDNHNSQGIPLEQWGGNGAQSFSEMTLRQYAAIKLKVPESGTGWLDHMIKVSLHDEFAAKAMQGLLATGEDYQDTHVGDGWRWYAKAAYAMADAMLEARKGGV